MVVSTLLAMLWYIGLALALTLILSGMAGILAQGQQQVTGYSFDDLRGQMFAGFLILLWVLRKAIVPP